MPGQYNTKYSAQNTCIYTNEPKLYDHQPNAVVPSRRGDRDGCNMGRYIIRYESCDHFNIFLLPPQSIMLIVKAGNRHIQCI